MGLRFRKSITLIPGLVTLNISKTGISFSLGPRGKSISVGTGGVYGNLSLGKGMSYRKKLTDLLPKGAGTQVDKTAKQLFLSGGEPLLRKFAKMHFRTARKAMGLPLDD